jgi:hypothetical protein
MQIIPLQAIANQSFTVVLDSNQWDFVIKSTNGTVSVSLNLNSIDVLDNARAVGNTLIIPCQYQEQQSGNFFILVQNFQLPDYTQFGVTQNLIYVSESELSTLRQPPSYPITAAFFNPDGGLPLRFSPQGYT